MYSLPPAVVDEHVQVGGHLREEVFLSCYYYGYMYVCIYIYIYHHHYYYHYYY